MSTLLHIEDDDLNTKKYDTADTNNVTESKEPWAYNSI